MFVLFIYVITTSMVGLLSAYNNISCAIMTVLPIDVALSLQVDQISEIIIT